MGKIKVDINPLNLNYNAIIESALNKAQFPSCYGQLQPPLLKKEIFVDSEILLAHKESGTPLSKYTPSQIIIEPMQDDSLLITEKGIEHIKAEVEKLANDYVEKITRCNSCKVIDTCYKISKLALETVHLYYK